MSQHDPLVRLRHMLDFANQAVKLMGGRSPDEFVSDPVMLLAMARLVELIGEAALRLPAETREQLPNIPWASIINMRHRLIHGYDMVNKDTIYSTVIQDLPLLIRQLREFLPNESPA